MFSESEETPTVRMLVDLQVTLHSHFFSSHCLILCCMLDFKKIFMKSQKTFWSKEENTMCKGLFTQNKDYSGSEILTNIKENFAFVNVNEPLYKHSTESFLHNVKN